jgi:hypothetical protein
VRKKNVCKYIYLIITTAFQQGFYLHLVNRIKDILIKRQWIKSSGRVLVVVVVITVVVNVIKFKNMYKEQVNKKTITC